MKTDGELFLDQLRALQHTLLSAAHQIDAMLEVASRPSGSDPEERGCPHPQARRLPTPAMGHPTRFFCQDCNQEVEG